MTVLTSESQVLNGTRSLPRVNLLPPEIAEKRAFKRVQMGLGVAVLASVGVVGALYMSASSSVHSAQKALDDATQQQASLQQKVSSYNGVTQVYAAVDAAQTQLTQAMGDEVRYSLMLKDLSLSVPSNVWLTSITYSQKPPATQSGAAGATQAVLPNGTTPIGTASFVGVGFSHDDVATWLDALAGLKGYANPYFSNSTEALIGQRTTVNFMSSADLTSAAESSRYNKPVGG